MVHPKSLLLAAVLAFGPGAYADPAPLSRYAMVNVEPAKTSIYIGSITLSTTPFIREGNAYAATYSARVFPYFFYNEKGKLWIDTSDDDLRRLERGETVNFTGHAVSEDGAKRRIEGRAVPSDAGGGKIKVRIFVSKRIDLVFNTTYAFPNK
jgi:hypothetical protein